MHCVSPGFTLTAATEQMVITEGNTTETFVYLDKNFQSDLPITITFSPRGLALIGKQVMVPHTIGRLTLVLIHRG